MKSANEYLLIAVNFMNQFHAHVYFHSQQVEKARKLRHQIQEMRFSEVTLGRLYAEPVGPHSLPMFVIVFSASVKNELLDFLRQNRNGLSVLIHEDTGDDYRDHTVGAEWLGESLPIRFEHFERIKHEKSALVFPE